jgi:hypothetical protein
MKWMSLYIWKQTAAGTKSPPTWGPSKISGLYGTTLNQSPMSYLLHKSTLSAESPWTLTYNASTNVNNHSKAPVVVYSCLQTVAHNKTKFAARQIEGADAASKLYHLLGRPGYSRFLSALKDNHILNCPITVDDAHRAELIYSKDITFLKGKTTASPAKDHLADFSPVALPPDLLSLHPNVTYVLTSYTYLARVSPCPPLGTYATCPAGLLRTAPNLS